MNGCIQWVLSILLLECYHVKKCTPSQNMNGYIHSMEIVKRRFLLICHSLKGNCMHDFMVDANLMHFKEGEVERGKVEVPCTRWYVAPCPKRMMTQKDTVCLVTRLML